MRSKPFYEVGYRRPPVRHQYPPGVSGNRNGRRRGTKNSRTILKELLASEVVVLEGETAHKTTMRELIIGKLLERATYSDKAAQIVLAMEERQLNDVSPAEQLIRLTDADKEVLQIIRQTRLLIK